jgi:hypothetical protein
MTKGGIGHWAWGAPKCNNSVPPAAGPRIPNNYLALPKVPYARFENEDYEYQR